MYNVCWMDLYMSIVNCCTGCVVSLTIRLFNGNHMNIMSILVLTDRHTHTHTYTHTHTHTHTHHTHTTYTHTQLHTHIHTHKLQRSTENVVQVSFIWSRITSHCMFLISSPTHHDTCLWCTLSRTSSLYYIVQFLLVILINLNDMPVN